MLMVDKQFVFISHSSADKKFADEICRIFEERELKCWIAPKSVKPGKRYASEVIQGIEASTHFLLLLSAKSNNSEMIKREVERAVSTFLKSADIRILFLLKRYCRKRLSKWTKKEQKHLLLMRY